MIGESQKRVFLRRTAVCSVPPVKPSMERKPARSRRARWRSTASASLCRDIPTVEPSRSSTAFHLESRYAHQGGTLLTGGQSDLPCRLFAVLQGPEHPNPGQPFTCRGFPRFCFLPDNHKGRKVRSPINSQQSPTEKAESLHPSLRLFRCWSC